MAHHADHVPGATHEALPHDPEHDIDAKSATWWVIGGTLVTFLSLWIMVPIFMRVLDAERIKKVDKAENTELDKLRGQENAFLGGSNPKQKQIDTVVDSLRK